ncbi:MAG: hypothetical protein H0U27_04200, partial [Nitrosopumilus sp.]|nr:hypothetical protein [Nitrosopumilus sp.]
LYQNGIIAKDCKNKDEGPGCCDTQTKLVKVKDNHAPVDGFKIQVQQTELGAIANTFLRAPLITYVC